MIIIITTSAEYAMPVQPLVKIVRVMVKLEFVPTAVLIIITQQLLRHVLSVQLNALTGSATAFLVRVTLVAWISFI